ncbi:MAG: hypothetical protein PHT07_20105 [Paludibacter sp.]|nr:hypothetical protein [Paludibacter sp.]
MSNLKTQVDELVSLNTQTRFIFSTSGSQSSIEKHNKALRTLGVNIIYFTFGYQINAETYINLLRAPISRGGAVTGQGLKSAVIPYLDWVEELAKKTGAVNTIINENGRLLGYNTDAFGFETALRRHIATTGMNIKRAVIYGNGGVSGVATHVLKSLGMKVTMTGRNKDRVETKMEELGLNHFDGPYDLVVNATQASTANLTEALNLTDILAGCKMVFDHNMPEKDGKSNYLQEYCIASGIHFIQGKDMYVPQMIKQWKLFLDGMDYDDTRFSISEAKIAECWELDVDHSPEKI